MLVIMLGIAVAILVAITTWLRNEPVRPGKAEITPAEKTSVYKVTGDLMQYMLRRTSTPIARN